MACIEAAASHAGGTSEGRHGQGSIAAMLSMEHENIHTGKGVSLLPAWSVVREDLLMAPGFKVCMLGLNCLVGDMVACLLGALPAWRLLAPRGDFTGAGGCLRAEGGRETWVAASDELCAAAASAAASAAAASASTWQCIIIVAVPTCNICEAAC